MKRVRGDLFALTWLISAWLVCMPVNAQSAAPAAGFVVHGGLTWMPIAAKKYTYGQAEALCAGVVDGRKGWRLPTQPELSALYASKGMHKAWVLGDTWTSTAYGPDCHHGTHLKFGMGGSTKDIRELYVTCVR